MFFGDLSLKRWVNESLSNGAVLDVVDANLFDREDEHFAAKQDCLLSITEVSLNCSADLPEERMNMKEVMAKLEKIKS